MNYTKYILNVLLGLALLWFLSKANRFIGADLFKLIDWYVIDFQEDSKYIVKVRIFVEVLVQFGFLLVGFLSLKKFKSDGVLFLTTIVLLYPFIFDLSNLIQDNSCVKAWQNTEKLLWYLPFRLILWISSYFMLRNLSIKLSRSNIMLIVVIFILYQLIRPY